MSLQYRREGGKLESRDGGRTGEVERQDVHDFRQPLRAVDVGQLLEHDLDLLPIGRRLSDEDKTLFRLSKLRSHDGNLSPNLYLCILDLLRRLIGI